jgi:hypothetical protein
LEKKDILSNSPYKVHGSGIEIGENAEVGCQQLEVSGQKKARVKGKG